MWCVFCKWEGGRRQLADSIVFGHSLCTIHARELAERVADGESVRKVLAGVLR